MFSVVNPLRLKNRVTAYATSKTRVTSPSTIRSSLRLYIHTSRVWMDRLKPRQAGVPHDEIAKTKICDKQKRLSKFWYLSEIADMVKWKA